MNRRRFLELLALASAGSAVVYSFPSVIVPKNIALPRGVTMLDCVPAEAEFPIIVGHDQTHWRLMGGNEFVLSAAPTDSGRYYEVPVMIGANGDIVVPSFEVRNDGVVVAVTRGRFDTRPIPSFEVPSTLT